MLSFFQDLHPIVQALLATGFTWGLTALGAASVFVTRTFDRRLLDSMLGFAAGVMTAASFWSLLAPAIDMAEDVSSLPAFVPAVTGFLMGGVFLRGLDFVLPHLHVSTPEGTPEGLHTTWRRSVLLVLAITLHNIPEGLAVGVAFGAAAIMDTSNSALLGAAVALAIGIGLQNFPEGIAVAMPLRREGIARRRAFWYGQLSALVEPFAAVLGAFAVVLIRPMLPYALAFAAGAMIYVVVEELIPESQASQRTDLATSATMLGFAVMMWLDVALG